MCSLDRVCTNSAWISTFPDSLVEHLTYPGSDHVSLLFHVRKPKVGVGSNRMRPFQFEARWMRIRECEDIIRESWTDADSSDSFDRLFRGVEACQLVLRQMMRGDTDNPRKQIDAIRDQINSLNKGDVTDTTKETLASLRAELEHLYMDEEIYWRQRCKNQWAREGDRKTRFFHAKASKRRKSNLITRLVDGAG